MFKLRSMVITVVLSAGVASLVTPVFAQLDISLKKGSNKWGYGGSHAVALQQWSGKVVSLVMEMQLPESGKPGFMPRESWLGIYLEDSKHRHRYTMGLFNPSWSPSPEKLDYAAVTYQKGGNFKVKGVKTNLFAVKRSSG